MITLSMKVKEEAPKKSRAKKKDKEADNTSSPMKTTLGDLFKAKMDNEGDA